MGTNSEDRQTNENSGPENKGRAPGDCKGESHAKHFLSVAKRLSNGIESTNCAFKKLCPAQINSRISALIRAFETVSLTIHRGGTHYGPLRRKVYRGALDDDEFTTKAIRGWLDMNHTIETSSSGKSNLHTEK